MPDPTPPLWFTRTAAAHLAAAARADCRRAAAAFTAGRVSADGWRDLVVAAVTPAVAAAARLARAAEFGPADRADLYERVAQIRSAAGDLAARFAPRDPAARPAGLALAGAVGATHAAYERRAYRVPGPAWERRIAGPGCPPACRTTRGAWRPAGEVPTPGDDPDCLCRMEYFSGVEPPPAPPLADRVSFRVWTGPEAAGLSVAQLRDLTAEDAADAVAQLGDDLDDDRRAVLEQVSRGAPRRAAPPNPRGNHFAADDPDPFRADYLSMLVAVPDPACRDLAGAAARLVRAAALFGAESRAAYYSPLAGYAPGRAALHDRLAATAGLTVPPAAGPPQALVVVGPPCSGKSRAAAAHARTLFPLWAESDALRLAERLPEYQGWNRDLLAAEGGDVAALAAEAAVAGGRNLVVECHGREALSPGRIAHRLAASGYAVHGLAVSCPAALAARRAETRFAENPFGLVDPAADPSPFTSDPTGGTGAKALCGYPGLASWTVRTAAEGT